MEIWKQQQQINKCKDKQTTRNQQQTRHIEIEEERINKLTLNKQTGNEGHELAKISQNGNEDTSGMKFRNEEENTNYCKMAEKTRGENQTANRQRF